MAQYNLTLDPNKQFTVPQNTGLLAQTGQGLLSGVGNLWNKNINNTGTQTLGGAVLPNQQPNSQFLGNSLPSYAPVIPTTPAKTITTPTVKKTTTTPTIQTPIVNPNGLTNEQLAQGYSTIVGDFNPATGQRWNTGSVGEIAEGTGYNYTAPTDEGYNYTGSDGNIYNSITGQVQNLPGMDNVPTEEELYQQKLKMYQGQIDATNASYADILNQSRIQGQARADQNRLQQVQGGIASSPMGSAQTAGVEAANLDIQKGIQNEQRLAVANILGEVRKQAVDAVKEKNAAKAKSADEYVKYLNDAPGRKAKNVSNAVKQLVSQNVDISQMTPEEIDSYVKGLGITNDEFVTEFNTQMQTRDDEATETKLKQDKIMAEIAKLKGEDKQSALDEAYRNKQIDLGWYNAQSSRMNAETSKTEKEAASKNYDSKTIPSDVKGELFTDLTSNQNAGRKEKKSLNDFIASYPEIDTDYLTELYEANN